MISLGSPQGKNGGCGGLRPAIKNGRAWKGNYDLLLKTRHPILLFITLNPLAEVAKRLHKSTTAQTKVFCPSSPDHPSPPCNCYVHSDALLSSL